MARILFLCIAFYLLSPQADAQQKYWIYFKDYAVENETNHDEVSVSDTDDYITILTSKGIEPIVHSQWLNAISAVLDNEQKSDVLKQEFVADLVPIDRRLRTLNNGRIAEETYSKVLRQIKADTLTDLNLTGKGVKIGIIDGGFLDADKISALKPIFNQQHIVGYKNYIEPEIDNPYTGSLENQDNHGTQVWTAIGGKESRDHYKGLAIDAEYYLARTDQGDKEYRGEEDFWVAALEWMHSKGVKLVNSSVGYSMGYDDPEENYKRSDVDGQSSAITKAATIAAKEKGMLIVVAGGNDGNNNFEIISVPADAEGVLSVGATYYRNWSKAGYSSVGPNSLESIKPEVSCFSLTGTSFSAPIITGLAACIWQSYPELTNQEVIDYIQQSAHLSQSPNNYLGYGVPNVPRLLKLIEGEEVSSGFREYQAKENVAYLPIRSRSNIVAFHKKNERIVIGQEAIRSKRGRIIVHRMDNATRTTVATPNEVIEIFWEK